MFQIILIILIITLLLALVWWNVTTRDIAYFDGLSMVELDPRFTRLTKGQKDDLSVDLKFPKDGARDGILLFMAGNGTNDFQIVYVQDGKLIVQEQQARVI